MLNVMTGAPAHQEKDGFREDLLSRICVRPPYYALEGAEVTSDGFSASAIEDGPGGAEIGPMTAANLSRHGAIAGLCAAALAQSDGDRRYYLAREAWFEGFASLKPHGARVTFHASLTALEKREARAVITAEADGDPIMRLEVAYTVLPEVVFARLFSGRRVETPVLAGRLPEGRVHREGEALVRDLEAVPLGACAGHFEGYPALPVAVLMGQLADLAGRALGEGEAYRVARGHVTAQDFCWALEPVRFSVEARERSTRRTVFECQAVVDGTTRAGMRLTLESKG